MKNSHFLGVGAICLFGVLAFANCLQNEFVHDDNYQIVRNPYLHSNQPISHVLFTDVWGYQSPGRGGVSNYYRPLQMLAYRWTVHAAGLNPFAFHLVNLTFHLLTTVMAYILLWQLTRKYGISLSASLLFALHPVHTEAVAWIAGLTELGCALFYFLSFWLFVRWYEQRSLLLRKQKKQSHVPIESVGFYKKKTFLMGASLLAFGFSLLWKEMAVTLPVVVGCYVVMGSERSFQLSSRVRLGILFSLPYLVVFLAYLVLRYHVLGFLSKSQQVWSLSVWEHFLNLTHLVSMYWFKLIIPINLNAFYIFQPLRSLADPRFWPALLFLILIISMGFYWFRKLPLARFSVAWVFLTLLPVLHIRGVGINVFTERYLYIPSLGFCLLVILLVYQALRGLRPEHRWWVSTGLLVIVELLYASQTVSRNNDWRNDFVFYSRAAQASPNSSAMQNSLAHALRSEKGDLTGAERHARRALVLAQVEDNRDPRQVAKAYLNLSNVYIQRKEYRKALEMSQKGMAADNTQPTMKIAHAVALMHVGHTEQARRIFLEVNQLLPNDELTLHFLGVIAISRKQLEEAVDYFKRALTVLPDYPDAHNNLAAAYVEMGRDRDALSHLQRAVELRPRDPVTYTNLAIVLSRLNRVEEARSQLRRALMLYPNFPPAMSQLSVLHQRGKLRK